MLYVILASLHQDRFAPAIYFEFGRHLAPARPPPLANDPGDEVVFPINIISGAPHVSRFPVQFSCEPGQILKLYLPSEKDVALSIFTSKTFKTYTSEVVCCGERSPNMEFRILIMITVAILTFRGRAPVKQRTTF